MRDIAFFVDFEVPF